MSYRAVAAVPGAPRLLASSVLGRLPLGTSTVALLLFVYDVGGTFAAAGAVVAGFTVTGALSAPVQGALVDRLGPLPVLAACAAGHAAGLVALVLAGQGGASTATLVAVAALAGALVPPIAACARAVWPEVAPDLSTRDAGYALDAVAQELIWVLGPLLVAVVVALGAASGAVLLSALLTVGGTALFASSPLVRAHGRPTAAPGPRPSLRSAPGMARVLVCVTIMGFGLGASEVGFPALAVDLGHPSLGALLIALLSVGSVAGGLWYGRRAWRSALETRHGILLLVLAALTAPVLAADGLAAAIALSLAAGAAWSPVLSSQYALIAELAPARATTTAFTWSTSAVVAGIAAGSALAGPLVDATSGRGALALAVAGYACGGAVALAPLLRRRLRGVSRAAGA